MSPAGEVLEISSEQIIKMIESYNHKDGPYPPDLSVVASDSYGAHMHRTWTFFSYEGEVVGTVERYWGGLKMICSVYGSKPRTTFFREDGIRTTNKGLRSPQGEEQYGVK